MNTGSGERSDRTSGVDWRFRVANAVGAAVCMAAVMVLGPRVGIEGFWPGMIAIIVAILVGMLLGRLVCGMLFRPTK